MLLEFAALGCVQQLQSPILRGEAASVGQALEGPPKVLAWPARDGHQAVPSALAAEGTVTWDGALVEGQRVQLGGHTVQEPIPADEADEAGVHV